MKLVKCAAVLLLVVFAFFLGRHRAHQLAEEECVRDTLVIRDTVKYYRPIPKDSAVIRYVTIEVPRSKPHWDKGKPSDITTQTEATSDTVIIPRDREEETEPPDTIRLPITQKYYSGKDYEAWVSGYRPSLDSISIQSSHTSIVHKRRPRLKRWGVGVQVGYGVTLCHRPELHPYIGIGVTYNIFNW